MVIAAGCLLPLSQQNGLCLGKDMVVWRDSKGTWRCFEDRCPHRLVLTARTPSFLLPFPCVDRCLLIYFMRSGLERVIEAAAFRVLGGGDCVAFP